MKVVSLTTTYFRKKVTKSNIQNIRIEFCHALSLSFSSSAFGMTIPLISASVRDYNDNAASCFARGVSAGVRAGAPKGRSIFFW